MYKELTKFRLHICYKKLLQGIWKTQQKLWSKKVKSHWLMFVHKGYLNTIKEGNIQNLYNSFIIV